MEQKQKEESLVQMKAHYFSHNSKIHAQKNSILLTTLLPPETRKRKLPDISVIGHSLPPVVQPMIQAQQHMPTKSLIHDLERTSQSI
jgi:hypothetical protein